MTNYDFFAKCYDEVMGDRAESAAWVQGFLKKYHPRAKTVLEIACGTGSVLQHLVKSYEVYGLDLSSEMLSLAKRKVPTGKFALQDMRSFKLKQKFDAIFCVYDSINHLLKFSDWQKVFKQAYAHLNDQGILIFDMNTVHKLNILHKRAPLVTYLKNNILITHITDLGNNTVNWNEKYFEHQNKNQYALFEENIQEKAFPVNRVNEGLKKL